MIILIYLFYIFNWKCNQYGLYIPIDCKMVKYSMVTLFYVENVLDPLRVYNSRSCRRIFIYTIYQWVQNIYNI